MPYDIVDPMDPCLSPYLRLRERDLTGREGRFIIEGETTLRHAIETGRFALHSVCVKAGRETGLEASLAKLPPEVEIYRVSQAVLDQAVGYHLHRGVLAVGIKRADLNPSRLEWLEILKQARRVLVLQGISNHDNMGGLFRLAAGFGVDLVVLDAGCCDPLYRKAIRVSVGASLSVPFVERHDELAAILSDLNDLGFAVWLSTPQSGASPLERCKAGVPPRLALVMGAEGPGLPAEVLRLPERHNPNEAGFARLTIPMAAGLDSLNVVTAAAIILAAVHEAGLSAPA